MSDRVHIREVGLRDGLQSLAAIMPTTDKLRWAREEAAAGVSEIEVCSFVPPKLLPQFADATDMVAATRDIPSLIVSALIPNLKGAERGIATGVHKMNYVLSVSESHNLANVRRATDESLVDFRRIMARRNEYGPGAPRISGGLSTAFGCSIEGAVPERRVIELAVALAEAGADEIVIADTVGHAGPAAVRRLMRGVLAHVGETPVAAHFHDTRGMGIANALAALDVGVRAFDASLAGLGGCPFAPGATGNVVTEDLVFLCDSMGLATGIDLEALVAVRRVLAEALPSEILLGGVAKAGLPYVPSRAAA